MTNPAPGTQAYTYICPTCNDFRRKWCCSECGRQCVELPYEMSEEKIEAIAAKQNRKLISGRAHLAITLTPKTQRTEKQWSMLADEFLVEVEWCTLYTKEDLIRREVLLKRVAEKEVAEAYGKQLGT